MTKIAKILCAFAFVVGLEFIDDEASVKNRQTIRYNNAQIQELIFTLNHLKKPII